MLPAGAENVLLVGVALVVAGLAGLLIFVMPLKVRLSVLAVLAVPQIMVPGLIESASIFQIWIIVCSLVMMIRERPRFSSGAIKLLLGMSAAALIAVLWSPLPNFAVIAAAQILSLGSIAIHAAHVLKEDEEGLAPAFKWLSFGVIVEAALVTIFRLQPNQEEAFLRSPAAQLLIGSEKIGNFFAGSPDNVFDPDKSGGLWLNANTASMFLGVSACAFFCVYKRYGNRWFLLTALVAASAVYFTGSKTGLVLLLALPAVAWVAPRLCRPKGRGFLLPVALLAYPAILAIQGVADALIPPDIAADSSLSLSTRAVIWDVASTLFSQNQVLGLGFGGWGENFYAFSGGALGRFFPPHNIIIAAWADYGMGGALMLCAFMAFILIGHIRRMGSSPLPISGAWGWSLAAFAWLWIHGMADAVTFYGDMRTLGVVGLLLGFTLHERAAERTQDEVDAKCAVPISDTNQFVHVDSP